MSSSLVAARDLSYHTPTELVALVLSCGKDSAQALRELRDRAVYAPLPFKRKGTM